MKKLLISLILSLLISLASLHFLARPKLKSYIETEGSKYLGQPLTLESVNFKFFPELGISASEIKGQLRGSQSPFKIGSALVTIPSLKRFLKKDLNLRLVLLRPEFKVGRQKSQSLIPAGPPVKIENGQASVSVPILPFETHLEVYEGALSFEKEASVEKAVFSDLNLKATLTNLSEPLQLSLSTLAALEVHQGKFETPLSLEAQFKINLEDLSLNTKEAQLKLGDLSSTIDGSVKLIEKSHQWKVKINNQNFSRPPWAGNIQGDVNLAYNEDAGLKVDGVVLAKNLKNGELETEGQFELNYGRGSVPVRANIQAKAFGGTAKTSRAEIAIANDIATVIADVNFSNFDMKKTVSALNTSWGALISGAGSGQIYFEWPDFIRSNIAKAATAKGKLEVANATLNTFNFSQLAKDRLNSLLSLTGIGHEKSGTPAVKLFTDFTYSKEIFNFIQLKMATSDQNELDGSGILKLDKTLYMKADIFLVTPALPSFVLKANSDSKGRFTIPIIISGNIENPQVELEQGTIQKILSRTLGQRGDKLIKGLAEELKKRLGSPK